MSHGWVAEEAGVWWTLPVFGTEAEKCSMRQMIEKKMGHLMGKASEYCKTLIQSYRSNFKLYSSQLAINFI